MRGDHTPVRMPAVRHDMLILFYTQNPRESGVIIFIIIINLIFFFFCFTLNKMLISLCSMMGEYNIVSVRTRRSQNTVYRCARKAICYRFYGHAFCRVAHAQSNLRL